MINLNELKEGTVLVSRELNQFWEGEQKKKYRALTGTVVAINHEAKEVTLMLNKGVLRIFKPENLWHLPYEAESPKNREEKLMSFIVAIYTGQVGTMGIQQVANELRQRGIKPIKARELMEVL